MIAKLIKFPISNSKVTISLQFLVHNVLGTNVVMYILVTLRIFTT